MKSISLNGKWKLYFNAEKGEMPSCVEEVKKMQWRCIKANVPGNVELDLLNAGIEDDPFHGDNVYSFRKYEFYQWWFERDFEVPRQLLGDTVMLNLKGINTFATIWINGMLCGKTENMLIEHSVDVSQAIKEGDNQIVIRIESPINKVRNKEFPANVKGNENHDEYVWLRMSAHSFGWDIAPRLLSVGIWRDIELVSIKNTHIKEVYYAVRTVKNNDAELLIKYRFATDDTFIEGFSIRVSGRCEGHKFTAEQPVIFCSGEMVVKIKAAKLWWPKGYGEANLYDMKFELVQNGKVTDERGERIGIRTIDIQTWCVKPSGGEFKIVVNNTPIMAKGTNWGALDALHSRDKERLKAAHDLMDDLGCNIVRCCGVNVYEDHDFFDLCDERGIMVWQDFALACGVYPQNDEFAHIIEKECAFIVKKLRNHPSIILWAGDNEVDLMLYDSYYRLPAAKYNRISREVLPRVVGSHDPFRHYVPSSPFIPDAPDAIAKNTTSDRAVPEQHCWGPRDYFKGKYYAECPASFISEIGYHGCPTASSIKKFISTEKLWPYKANSEWDTHNTDYIKAGRRHYNRNELMANQVKIMFGYIPNNLEEFAIASQITQAEALKFFIENARIKKWEKTGIMWWNLIDCWPQFSDSVVDYYYKKKLAYHYIKRVMQPICIMMAEPQNWEHAIVIGNDSRCDVLVNYTVEDGITRDILASGSVLSKANENMEIAKLKAMEASKHLYLIRWEIDGVQYTNHYISGYVPFDFSIYKLWLKKIKSLPQPFDIKSLLDNKAASKEKDCYATTRASTFGDKF